MDPITTTEHQESLNAEFLQETHFLTKCQSIDNRVLTGEKQIALSLSCRRSKLTRCLNAGRWHSHTGVHYQDGLRAPLIIHGPSEPHQYDEEYTIILSDWYHERAEKNQKVTISCRRFDLSKVSYIL